MSPIRRPRLGELEMGVMDHLWSKGRAHVKAVHDAVGVRRGITLNTVQSALKRLYRKGLLSREKVSHAYIYAPRVSREELIAQAIDDVVSVFAGAKAEPLLSAFVDLAARVDAQSLDHLEELIAAHRAQAVKGKR